MRGPIIAFILITMIFGAGFISFENKKGKYGAELDEVRSEFNTLKERQSGIESLRTKRGDYFTKIFFLNRPFDLSRAVSKFLNFLSEYDTGFGGISKVSIKRATGKFDFIIKLKTGIYGKQRIKSFIQKLESVAGAFILSETFSADSSGFEITGEVSAE